MGSTIKTEEEAGSDPYALLTVIGCVRGVGDRRLG